MVRVPHEALLVVEPNDRYPKASLTDEYRIRIQVQSMDLQEDVKNERIDIVFINDQTRVFVNDSAIEQSGIASNDGIQLSSPDQLSYELDVSSWVYGPAFSYSLACYDCVGGDSLEDIISLQNRVTPSTH